VKKKKEDLDMKLLWDKEIKIIGNCFTHLPALWTLWFSTPRHCPQKLHWYGNSRSGAHSADYSTDSGGKAAKTEADHSPPNNTVVKNTGISISTLSYAFKA
jgi:hypothetical protein